MLSQQNVVEGILNMAVTVAQTDEFLQYASGGRLLPGSVPLAHRYGGHQVEFVSHSFCPVRYRTCTNLTVLTCFTHNNKVQDLSVLLKVI